MSIQYLLIDSHIVNIEEESILHGRFIPYGLSILDNALREAGYNGKLLLEKEEYTGVVASPTQEDEQIKLIGIGSSTLTRFDAKTKIEECRARFPESVIVAGGPHFGNCAEDALQNIRELDIVVRGEGEEVILDLMRYADKKMGIDAINGISYRNGVGDIVSQGPKLVVDKLSSLRFMEKFYSIEQFNGNPLSAFMPIPSMNILAGRGCPYGCIFCSVNRTKNRVYTVKEIVDIIQETTVKYGIKGVKFQDDALTLNEAYIASLCDEIKRRNLEIYWWCDSRANIKLELLEKMYSAGCRYISVGLETGSPKIQKIVGKNISNEQITSFAKKCREVGILPYIFLMASFPDETPEDLELTVQIAKDLCKKHKAIAGGMGAAVIVPGTQLERIAKERGILPADFSWHKPYHNPTNLLYDVTPTMPLYIEGISPEVFSEARRKMLANYADSLTLELFLKNAVENLVRKDISWSEKVSLGSFVLKTKLKSFLTA